MSNRSTMYKVEIARCGQNKAYVDFCISSNGYDKLTIVNQVKAWVQQNEEMIQRLTIQEGYNAGLLGDLNKLLTC